MTTNFLKNQTKTLFMLRRHSITDTIKPQITPKNTTQQYYNGYYSRIPCKSSNEIYSSPYKTFSRKFCSASETTSSFNVVGWYLGMVKSRPILTKSITSACIYTAADFTSQTIAGSSSDSYDFVRTARMAGYGLIILGPSLHFWFNFVSKVLPKRDVFTTLKKIVMGQTLYGPLMTVVFFSVNAALQGENVPEIEARLKRDLVPTLISGVMYWPICDFITFKFIPVHLQPLVSNSFSYLWTVYITYMASLEKATISSYELLQE